MNDVWTRNSVSILKVKKRKKAKNDINSNHHGKTRKDRPVFGFSASRNVLKFLGPSLITGASDDDPSGIATYS
jgi:hypothetical protein